MVNLWRHCHWNGAAQLRECISDGQSVRAFGFFFSLCSVLTPVVYLCIGNVAYGVVDEVPDEVIEGPVTLHDELGPLVLQAIGLVANSSQECEQLRRQKS